MIKKLTYLIIALIVFLPMIGFSAVTLQKSKAKLSSGLIGHWTMDALNITSNITDSSGQGNHGFLSAGLATTTVIGQIGQGIQLAGGSTLIDIPDMVEGLTQVTVATWVRQNDVSGLQNYIIEQTGAGSDPFQLDYGTGTGGNDFRYRCGVDTGAGSITTGYTTTGYTDRNWHHVACVYNGVDIRLYVDGVLKVTPVAQTGTLASTATDLHIGGDTLSLTGNVDDFRIYNRGLSAQEVQALWAMGGNKINKTPQNNLSGMLAHWTFDAINASSTITDSFGTNNAYYKGAATSTGGTHGKIAQGFKFDGTDDFVQTGGTMNFGTTKIVTLSFWMHKTAFGTDDDFAFELSTDYNSNDGAFIVDPNAADGTFKVGIQDSVTTVKYRGESFTRPSANEWHHYVIVIDNTTTAGDITVYVDGVAQSTTVYINTKDKSSNIITARLYMMSRAGTSLFGQGILDDVRVFNRVITAEEAKLLYRLGTYKIIP